MVINKDLTSKKDNDDFLKLFARKSGKKKIVIGNRAVIYYRVSSENQVKFGNSLEWQKEICEKYCKEKGYEIVAYFGGTFESAQTDDDRKEFSRMMKFVRTTKPKIDRIVFFSFDRFSRSGDTTMIDELLEIGVSVESVTQLGDDNTPEGIFMKKLLSLFSNQENLARKKKTREGMKAKLRRGEWIGKPTFGYDKREPAPGAKPQCYINEDGKLIRQAFIWAADQNMTNTEIVRQLNNMGLKISEPQLSRIFRNVFYIGYITHNLLDDGEMKKGIHEPLVSEEVFYTVNRLLDKNPSGWTMKKDNDAMPLKIFVKCGCCNKSLTAYPQKGKYYYYKCPTKDCCVNIRNIQLHQLFTDKLKQYVIAPNSIPGLQVQLVTTYWKLHESDAARVKPLKDELTVLKNELNTLESNFVFGRIPPDLYDKYADNHRQRIAIVETDLEKIAVDSSNLENRLKLALNNCSNLLEIWDLLNYKGKQRLQYLVFPSGMTYHKENNELRTLETNPMFSAISLLSKATETPPNTDPEKEEELLHQLYSVFPSSNFFREKLDQITDTFKEIEDYYPTIWESVVYKHINPFTGATEQVKHAYISDFTGYTLNGNLIIDSQEPVSDITLSLYGPNYRYEAKYSGCNMSYLFTGLTYGNYSLHMEYQTETGTHSHIHTLVVSANTIYNLGVNKQ